MAKEQKAIAKLVDKDGITVDFWRFPIKNVDKIISQVLELVGKSRLGLSKDYLKNFDTFVIQTTEPNGTVIDTVFECSDVEFLDLVKEDYKDYFGYYPSEDKYDSEKWSYILSGHKGYKESKKSAKRSLKESTKWVSDVADDLMISFEDILNVFEEYGYGKKEAQDFYDSKWNDVTDAFNEMAELAVLFELEDWTESKKSVRKSIKENLTRYDMIGQGFFVLISDISFGLCEQLGNKTQDTNWIRSFDTEKQAIKFADKKGYPIVYEKFNESKKPTRKSMKESFEYDGAIPLDDLMNILTDEWQENNTNNLLFRESSHWDDSARDEGKYVEISAIADFTIPWSTGFGFNNKKVQKDYDKEIESVEKHYTFENEEDYNDMTEELEEYQPILFIIDIDLKEKIVYANVDLGNGLSDTEVARERLAENEDDFREQIQRMIESF